MAQLKKSVLGKVSGTVGDITFRQTRGKNVISLRPRSFIPGDDLPSVERRARFALSAKLAQAVNSVPQLRRLWVDETPPDMSPYNYMIGVNFGLVGADHLTNLTTITPSSGFSAESDSISIAPDAVTVSLKPIGTGSGIDTTVEPYVMLASILCLSKPTVSTMESMKFIALTSADQPLVVETALNFTIAVGAVNWQLVSSYEDKVALLALITLNSGKEPVRCSNTIQSR
jgi:hypothetical protein